ncbi:MAG: pilus assembly protein PilM [Deferribacterales bacterium]
MSLKFVNSIVIGEDRIEHGLFKKIKGGVELINFSYFSFDFNDVDKISLIANELKNYTDKDRYTFICFAMRDIIKDILPFKGKSKDIKLEIFDHLKETYMVELSEYNLDYTVNEVDEMNIVYAVMIYKELSDTIYKALIKNGFKLLTAETDCDSLMRSSILLVPDEEFYLHVHIRGTDTTMFILKNNKIMLERHVKEGWDDIIDLFSNAMSLDIEGAENILVDKGFDRNKTNEKELDAITNAVDKLTIQVQRTMDLYFQTYRSENVSSIVISGRGIDIPDLDRYWSEIFAMQVKKVNIGKLAKVNIDFDIRKLNYLDEMVGLGLNNEY